MNDDYFSTTNLQAGFNRDLSAATIASKQAAGIANGFLSQTLAISNGLAEYGQAMSDSHFVGITNHAIAMADAIDAALNPFARVAKFLDRNRTCQLTNRQKMLFDESRDRIESALAIRAAVIAAMVPTKGGFTFTAEKMRDTWPKVLESLRGCGS